MIVNKKSLFLLRLFSDMLMICAAFLLAAVFAQPWEILMERYYMFFLLIGLNLLWIVSSNYFSFYDDFSSRNFPVQFTNILKNTLLQLTATVFFIFLVKEGLFTRNFIVYNTVFLILLISLRVVIFRKVLKFLRKRGRNIRNILIIGNGELAQNFKEMITSNPDFGYDLKSVIIDDNGDLAETNPAQIENKLLTLEIDEVVIAYSDVPRHLIERIIKICDKNAAKVHIVPDYISFVSSRFQLTTFGDFPIITARREPLEEAQWRLVKRIFDIVFSLVVTLLVLSWMFPLVFILSKFFSKGSVLFIQERIGTKNKKFNCYKFRTMVHEKEAEQKFKPAVENDPRITKLGKFLRRSNLDELPQFINVLKGEMSVVGPRPHAVPYDDYYGKVVDEIRIRHNVKPGITGWAQIHGLRGDVADEVENRSRTKKRIEYDIWYIENWSFTLDLQIILVTIWKMLRGRTQAR